MPRAARKRGRNAGDDALGVIPASVSGVSSLVASKTLVLGKMISHDAKKRIEAEEAKHDVECPICMEKMFAVPYTGSLTGCGHVFCFKCIEEWSKTENSCPLCKKEFKCIKKSDGLKQIRVDDEASKDEYEADGGTSKKQKKAASSAKHKPVTVRVKKRTQAQTLEEDVFHGMGANRAASVELNMMLGALIAARGNGGRGDGLPLPLGMMALAAMMPRGDIGNILPGLPGLYRGDRQPDGGAGRGGRVALIGSGVGSSSSGASSSSREVRDLTNSPTQGTADNPICLDDDDDVPPAGRPVGNSSSSSSNSSSSSSSNSSSSSSGYRGTAAPLQVPRVEPSTTVSESGNNDENYRNYSSGEEFENDYPYDDPLAPEVFYDEEDY